MTRRFRVATTKAEEIHTGATFAPGEEAVGIDPSHPDDARKIEAGVFVEISGGAPPTYSDAVIRKATELGVDLATVKATGKRGVTVPDVERTHENQEVSK